MSDTAKTVSASKLMRKLTYASKCLPSYAWQRLSRRSARGWVHLILGLADHFEPSTMPGELAGPAPREEQEERLEN
jgi:hypothetical protein